MKWYIIGTIIICVSALCVPLLGIWALIPILTGAGIQVGCFVKAHMEMKALDIEHKALKRNMQIGMRDHDSPS